ncbi:MAG: epoxyqueuosine reductase [Desulfosarcina sp.]|nr:epoxyqueuosine reductase [Desulfobacterales bacterium]
MSEHRLKSNIRSYALQEGVDLVGLVSTRHLNAVTPTRYKPSRLWPAARTAISVGKRLLTGAVAVGTGDMVQNARWVAWRTNESLNRRAMEIGHFVEQQGSRALPLSNGTMVDPDWTNLGIFGELSHRHVAAEAGLGTIGVPTYIVTPQFGPRVYFNTILTEAELEPDPRLDFNPCGEGCDECIKACPNDAIIRGRRTIKKKAVHSQGHAPGCRGTAKIHLQPSGKSGSRSTAPAARGFRFCTSSSGPCAGGWNDSGLFSLSGGLPRGVGPERRNPAPEHLKN